MRSPQRAELNDMAHAETNAPPRMRLDCTMGFSAPCRHIIFKYALKTAGRQHDKHTMYRD